MVADYVHFLWHIYNITFQKKNSTSQNSDYLKLLKNFNEFTVVTILDKCFQPFSVYLNNRALCVPNKVACECVWAVPQKLFIESNKHSLECNACLWGNQKF